MKNPWLRVSYFGIILSTVLSAMPPQIDEGLQLEASRAIYINLIKKVLANTIYEDNSTSGEYVYTDRLNGRDRPLLAHTAIGCKGLDNIQDCLQDILINDIPGDCIEVGVGKGGSPILMRAILKAYGDTNRKVWLADAFIGSSLLNVLADPKDLGDEIYTQLSELALSMEIVQENFRKYGLLDDQVLFLKGSFSNTLPAAPIDQLALLQLETETYKSTMTTLKSLYPKLSIGGYVILSNHGRISACAQAIHDYRVKEKITDPLIPIHEYAVYWKKN